MIKLPNSQDPAVLAENIVHLRDGIAAVDAKTLPATTSATTGQILKLTGENKTPTWADEYSYTPPAYSETETATGQKWIDNSDIYSKVITGTFGEITQTSAQTLATLENIYPLSIDVILTTSDNDSITINRFSTSYKPSTGILQALQVTTTYSAAHYKTIVNYVKIPTPSPETRDDDTEPEAKKTTRTKTTKKED